MMGIYLQSTHSNFIQQILKLRYYPLIDCKMTTVSSPIYSRPSQYRRSWDCEKPTGFRNGGIVREYNLNKNMRHIGVAHEI